MGPTVGISGGGQLAWMLLPAAARLGLPTVLLAGRDDPATALCCEVEVGTPNAEGLRRLGDRCDVLTVEHELVDRGTLAALASEGKEVWPSAATLDIANDKLRQREVLGVAGVPLAPWIRADGRADLESYVALHGTSLTCKRPSGGDDGRGVWFVTGVDAAAAVLDDVDGPLLVEPQLPFERELAVLVARRPGGQTVVYDPVQTVQEDGMCREVLLPAPVEPAVADEARRIGLLVAETVGSVGMLAIELFQVDGKVLFNEIAARPHNAGHVTIEGAVTSQFENHLRGICDLPLGSTATRAPAAMVNVVGEHGDPRDRIAQALQVDDVAVHLYGKGPRPGRKLGHVTAVTAVGDHVDDAVRRARRAAAILAGGAAR